MNIKRILRQLRREAIANPKKAAVLGLLVLVAMWFWLPLLRGLATPDEQAPSGSITEPVVSAAKKDASAGVASATREPDSPQHPWHKLVEWMESDPRTSAAKVSPRRDPFAGPEKLATAVRVEDPAEESEATLTPEGLGMVLSSTLVGPRRRVALISGRSYREGEIVRQVKQGQEFTFMLAEVHPRRVILERNGRQFKLEIPAPASSGSMELIEHVH